jgi:hypothetical protein
MASYFISQAYDAPSRFIWSVLTDFPSWPAWFPRMTQMRLSDGSQPGKGADLIAIGKQSEEWTRWTIVEWAEPSLLLCEYRDSNVPISHGVEAAYLQFELFDDPDGCTLEIEIGADGGNIVGDFFVGMTLGTGARRILPQLVDAFSAHVVRVASKR